LFPGSITQPPAISGDISHSLHGAYLGQTAMQLEDGAVHQGLPGDEFVGVLEKLVEKLHPIAAGDEHHHLTLLQSAGTATEQTCQQCQPLPSRNLQKQPILSPGTTIVNLPNQRVPRHSSFASNDSRCPPAT
jgi:hypothetical protein